MGELKALAQLASEVRRLVEVLIDFPERLARSIYSGFNAFSDLRGKVRILREVAALREIAKELRRLSSGKADFLVWIEDFEDNPSAEEWGFLQDQMMGIAHRLTELRTVVLDNTFSDNVLANGASAKLSTAAQAFQQLSTLEQPESDADMTELKEVGTLIRQLNKIGDQSLEQLDNYRIALEHTG